MKIAGRNMKEEDLARNVNGISKIENNMPRSQNLERYVIKREYAKETMRKSPKP